MDINFTKMHGISNNYIYISTFTQEIEAPRALAIHLSHRHKGIGGDGLVLMAPPSIPGQAHGKMIMYNADGSRGLMCGNAIRCVGKYLYDKGLAKNTTLKIETDSGIKTIKLIVKNGMVTGATVDMGPPIFVPKDIPVNIKAEQVINKEILIGGRTFNITCLSMGNPHCVIFTNNIEEIDLPALGPLFENHDMFPKRVNTEFVNVLNKNHLKMRVWERGSGETMACGTGACAAVVAAVENRLVNKNEDVTVTLLGGDLTIKYTEETVYMTGDCVEVFNGTISI